MRSLLLTCLLTSLVCVFASVSSIEDVLSDFNNINTCLTRVGDDINALGGGTLAITVGVRTNANTAIDAIVKATTDVKSLPVPVSNTDATKLLQSVQGLLPVIVKVLDAITSKRQAFQGLSAGVIVPIIQQNLADAQAKTTALAEALTSACPDDLLQGATSIQAQIDVAFSRCTAAYN